MRDTGLEWFIRSSPSLMLVLDENLVCMHMAEAWRSRLSPELAMRSSIPADALFDFANADGLFDRFSNLVRDGDPLADATVGLFLASGTLPTRIGAWRALHPTTGRAHLVVTATDVSEYRDAKQEFSKLQRSHRLILDAAGEGIYGLDLQGKITFGNRTAEDIVGWTTDQVLGELAHALHHHSHADGSPYPSEQCPIYATLKDNEVHSRDDEVFWHVDGTPVPVEYTTTPVVVEGKTVGAVVVFKDVRDRKAIEAQRKAAFEEIATLKMQLEQERDYLRDEISVATNAAEIIGESDALARALVQIDSVARTPVSVLVLGESGVGKEMVARAIHAQSDRADKPLIKVNCASVPKDLFESEFFGHVRGSFTGAHKDRVGRLQLADGGTLFLDEVGEIPVSQQAKLLRALQEGEFERVGDERTMKVDVRIVAATNRDLAEEIRLGRFRQDLYYRISVFPLEIPPLRVRLADIAPLALHFIQTICRELGREPLLMSQAQLSILKSHDWPGNIRELKNVIERAVISSSGTRLRLDATLSSLQPSATFSASGSVVTSQSGYVTAAEFKELEKGNIIAALQAAGGKTWGPDGAAELLGLKPSTLAYRMKTLGIEHTTKR